MTKFVYSKLKCDLTIYHLPETWIVQNLDSKANWYIHKLLGIPNSGNVNHLRLKVKQLGISLKLPSDIYRLNQITVTRNILKSLKNQSMRTFWNNWHAKHLKWWYRKKISKCKDCQINSWQQNSERNNDIK